MQIAALSIVMSDGDLGPKRDICQVLLSENCSIAPETRLTSISVRHPVAPQSMLKLRAHESISIAALMQNPKVYSETSHVDHQRYPDQTNRSSHEMPEKQLHTDFEVA